MNRESSGGGWWQGQVPGQQVHWRSIDADRNTHIPGICQLNL